MPLLRSPLRLQRSVRSEACREKDADGEEGALVDEGVDAGEVACAEQTGLERREEVGGVSSPRKVWPKRRSGSRFRGT